MKAVVYDAPRSFAIKEIPDPQPGPDEVRIKVIQVGVCGTDLHIHNGDFNAAFPLIPGHELVGIVEAVGSGVTRVKVGEQVSVNPNVNCGLCDYCLAGTPILCTALQGLGSNFPGFFAEYVVTNERLVFSTEGLPIDTAVFTEPAACATHGLERLNVWPGSSALVFGAGPTGLLLAQLIKSGGAASVTVAAPTRFKLDLASAFGIDHTIQISRSDAAANQKLAMEASGGRGYDIVVEATGSTDVGEICVGLTRNGGTMLVYGVTRGDETISFHPFELFRREISIIGSFAEITSFASAIAALRSGRIHTDGMITHRFALEDYGAALEALRSDKTAHKVLIVP
jgi:D-arabinitol dehydrogenase (NADP+)